jgi:nicotinamide-nucleotide adenylyltransferase
MPTIHLPVRRAAMIARWKPVHLGHAVVLRALSGICEELVIGLGSSNIVDARSPFTVTESEEMVRRVLGPRAGLSFEALPDLFDGPRWRAMVVEKFRGIDLLFTGNRYVRDLLRHDFQVLHPVQLLSDTERVALSATQVRAAMGRGEDWRALVPPEVRSYLENEGIADRVISRWGPMLASPDSGVSTDPKPG